MKTSILETTRPMPTIRPLDLGLVRAQFPSLRRQVNGHPVAFLDGPGGTQVPRRVIDAISEYLSTHNANTCGAYATSRQTDQVIAEVNASVEIPR